MHKLFLTKNECEIIHGASKIVETVGGFPSMENGELITVSLQKGAKQYHFDVVLIFDITGWKHTAFDNGYEINDFAENRIRMSFKNMRSVDMHDPFSERGEIKFYNSCNRDEFVQDSLPCFTPTIERPFCCFCICSGLHVVLEFEEEECDISADIFSAD